MDRNRLSLVGIQSVLESWIPGMVGGIADKLHMMRPIVHFALGRRRSVTRLLRLGSKIRRLVRCRDGPRTARRRRPESRAERVGGRTAAIVPDRRSIEEVTRPGIRQ